MRRFLRCLTLLTIAALAVAFVLDHPVYARGGGGRGGGGRGGGRGGWGGRGGRGGGSPAVDRGTAAKDVEARVFAEEKEDRITEARAAGAENAYEEMMDRILLEDRERANQDRRRDWRSRANPG